MLRLQSQPPPRQGVILLIVVVLLALFLVVGLSFVWYSESEATASRIYREASFPADVADLPPEQMLSFVVGQLLFDAKDDLDGTGSAARGHSLARTLYGWNYTLLPTGVVDSTSNSNTMAFNGTGPLRGQQAPPAVRAGLASIGATEYDMVNYQWFSSDGFVRDPERLGWRADPGQPLNPYAGGANVPYTFPDRTNLYLAAVQAGAANGPRVLKPSFHLPNSPFGPLDPANPNWYVPDAKNPALKYLVLRPRPADHLGFPAPEDAGGDVKNLPSGLGFGGGKNDSFWMDLGYPVQTTRNGRKYKPMFAMLILDMDSRINLNTDGNLLGGDPNSNPTHASHQGLGKHEVNLSKVLNADAQPPNVPAMEWRQILLGAGQGAQYVPGRYGKDQVPAGPRSPSNAYPDPYLDPRTQTSPIGLRSYLSKLDFDAVDENQATRPLTNRFTFPSQFRSFPDYSTVPGYDNLQATSTTANPRLNHALLYNKLQLLADDQAFGSDNMYHILAGDYKQSRLYVDGIIPVNLGGPNDSAAGRRIRQQITTHSYDLDVPGAVPWLYQPLADYQWNGYTTGATFPNNTPFPAPATNNPQQAFPGSAAWTGGPGQQVNDFRLNDGRINVLSRLDLNRKLTSYYAYDATKGGLVFAVGTPPTGGTLEPPAQPGFWRAQWERQQLAGDIFQRLILATGALPISQLATATPQQVNALRWLAQLAVNIVDYIDEDDFSTPFNWKALSGIAGQNEFVFGTEVPKLVVNEAYAEARNEPGDPIDDTGNTSITGATKPFHVNFFIELYNPHPPADPTGRDKDLNITGKSGTPQDRATALLQLGTNPQGIYQIQIVDESQCPPTDYRDPANTDGSVPPAKAAAAIKLTVDSFAGTAGTGVQDQYVVLPNDGTAGPPAQKNQGFYVLGPAATTVPGQSQPGDNNFETAQTNPANGITGGVTLAVPSDPAKPQIGLSYQVTDFTRVPPPPPKTYTILLRRLACPYRPADNNPVVGGVPNPNYNPYITVDYFTGLQVTNAVKYVQNPAAALRIPKPKETTYDNQRSSIGREQPYAGVNPSSGATGPSLVAAQTGGNGTKNTFFKHNSNSPPANGKTFDWLVHLDRPLTGPMELLHVSGFKPHELTQQFMTAPSASATPDQKFNHRAPFFVRNPANAAELQMVQSARIFRALEYLTVGDRSLYPGTGGRIPGKVNINTVFDPEVLDALIDAPPQTGPGGNFFTQQAVSEIWNKLQARRSATFGGTSTTGDQPIYPLAVPITPAGDQQYPGAGQGIGLVDTILGGTFTPQQPTSFASGVDQSHPYVANELLTKISSHLTTRSNVFAVFVTVGFFEVMDDSTRPVKLGAEMKLGGRTIRHRMFSLIDRTQLAFDPTAPNGRLQQSATPPVFMTSESAVTVGARTANLTIAGGIPTSYDGNPAVTIGSVLFADTGVGQEQVTVTASGTDPNDPTKGLLTVTFPGANGSVGHAAGFTLCNVVPGNPGPQGAIDYNLPQYKGMFPFTYIMQ